ncbi:MAG: hypothetical protein D3924_03975 [Candidatus Electrothrix sp. AR4]|nr:hypothetical protein [Candidatus Electrothrix sp. AR4]
MNKASPVLFFLIAGIISLSYSNTFYASWHLDDEPNIINNSKLHLSSLDLQQINTTFRALPYNDRLYRPLACLSFALNWYIGQDNVFGYHVVNIIIHILTSWFLFLTLHLLLHIHYKKQYPPQFFTAAALFSALFWALAPIQTQAVTYIVQRMASMAAMFTIIAIYSYLLGKTEKKSWFFICLLSFFAAIGSKENALLLPASLVLIEISFFRHNFTKKHISLFILAAGTALICVFLFVHYGLHITLFSFSNPLSFLDGYDTRSFTFSERILTQPRIVLTYLSQIFLPSTERLSVEHDITLSTSLIAPWTTLPAILIISLLIAAPLFFFKKFPLVSFPLLFFFLNHSVESTILPLEFFFEHRNYLPSFFLFLPISIFVAHTLYNPDSIKLSFFGRTAVIFCATLFLIISGHASYTRNSVWATEETLWSDVMRKAPNSPRAAHNLGRRYRQFGQYREAYHYFQLAYQNSNSAANPEMSKKAALNGLASVTYMLGNYKHALEYFSQCLNINEKDEACLKNRALANLQLGQHKQAFSDLDKLTQEYPLSIEYPYLAAVSAYKMGDHETALKRVQKIAGRTLKSEKIMHLAGVLLLKTGAYKNSLFFLKRSVKLSPNTITYHLTLAGAHYAVNQTASARKTIHNLLKKHPLPGIKKALQKAEEHNELGKNAVNFIKNIVLLSLHSNTLTTSKK